jgi:putative hydrolase of HD superfamily
MILSQFFMESYESRLFGIAPWTKEVMTIAKSLNNNSLMRGRSGWIRRGVKNPESIYEHSCKVGLAAYYLIGTSESVAMGLVHDFGEISTLDRLPGEIPLDQKRNEEYTAMKWVKGKLPNSDRWFDTWEKFENKVGIGGYLTELDKICPTIQAINYMRENNGNGLEEFYPYARKKLKTPQLVELLDDLYSHKDFINIDAYEYYFDGLSNINL